MRVGAAQYGSSRPDIAAQYGARFENCGYTLTWIIAASPPGAYEVFVHAHCTMPGRWHYVSRSIHVVQPTPTATVTSTRSPTPTRTVVPCPYNEVLNGDFEDGLPGYPWVQWSEDGRTLISREKPHTGGWGACLGRTAQLDILEQYVYVYRSDRLTFWYRYRLGLCRPATLEVLLHNPRTNSVRVLKTITAYPPVSMYEWGECSIAMPWDLHSGFYNLVFQVDACGMWTTFGTAFFIDDVCLH